MADFLHCDPINLLISGSTIKKQMGRPRTRPREPCVYNAWSWLGTPL